MEAEHLEQLLEDLLHGTDEGSLLPATGAGGQAQTPQGTTEPGELGVGLGSVRAATVQLQGLAPGLDFEVLEATVGCEQGFEMSLGSWRDARFSRHGQSLPYPCDKGEMVNEPRATAWGSP